MKIAQLPPDQVAQQLESDKDAVLIDVRSIVEFNAGHPKGAFNVPIMDFDSATGEMAPNLEFTNVIKKNFQPYQKLYLSCKSGGRSQRACEMMAEIGYEHLTNVAGGFSGSPGQSGWQSLGLPIENTPQPGHSYRELR